MSDIEIRPVEMHERRQAADAFRTGLITGAISDELMETMHASWDNGMWLAAWDDERCVGHVGAYRFDTTVPGGARLPTAGFSRVGVLPTHTRRGLLTQMMQRSLREAHEEGQVLASLRASEAPIYGRFGYGQAGDYVAAHITTAKARPLRGTRANGSMRLLRMSEVLEVVPPLYDRVARRWVGTIGRPDWMWERYLKGATEPASAPFGKGEFVAVHTDSSGVDDGYVHYETELVEGFAAPFSGGGTIHDLWGASAEIELALWQYLFDIDLITTWQADERPVNDPIRRSLHDVRAYETRQIIDEQWVRLLDVDAALTARTYGPCSETLTIAVTDPLLEANNERWAISSTGACRTTEPADVVVDIGTLSTAYMGGVAWRDLAASALLPTEVDDVVLDRLDALFAIRPVGYCGSFF